MSFLKRKMVPASLVSFLAAATLMACGGGGGTPAVIPTPTTPAALTPDQIVANASSATATSLGATVISGAANEEVYNMVATIGDSWQLVLNNATNLYTLKVLNTQFGLVTSAPIPFTKTVNGSLITYTGTGLNVQVDTRTKTVVGQATLGSKTSTVSGTGYSVTDTTSLAGDYVYVGATHNLDGTNPNSPLGTLRIAANGVDSVFCDGGRVNAAGTCDAFVSGNTVKPPVAGSFVKDAAGLIHAMVGSLDTGIVYVTAGDRGPVLQIDRFGLNSQGINRIGVMYAAKLAKLSGNEFDGNWTCMEPTRIFSAKVVGTNYTLTTDKDYLGTLAYNVAPTGIASPSSFALDGVLMVQDAGNPVTSAGRGFPLSSSMAVVSNASSREISVCRKAS